MKKMREVGYRFRRLYEQLVESPVSRRKSTTPQVHSRVSKYPTRWTIWGCGVLIFCIGGSAYADRDVIILSGVLNPGTVIPGGAFADSGTVTRTVSHTDAVGSNALLFGFTSRPTGGLLFVKDLVYGLRYGVQIPGTPDYGIQIPSLDIYLKPRSGSNFKVDLWNDTNDSRAVVDIDTSTSALCRINSTTGTNPVIVESPSDYVCYIKYANTGGSQIPGKGDQTTNVSWNVAYDLYTGPNPQPGTTQITWLGGSSGPTRDFVWSYSKPTKIVLSGLTCSFNNPAIVELQPVAPSSSSGIVAASATPGNIGLTVSCMGTNGSGVTIPISYTLAPTAGGITEQKTKLKYNGQPSFYMLFTKDGSVTCNSSDANAIPLDGVTPVKITDVKNGSPMNLMNVPLGATLCTTGDTTQAAGNYQMAVTASIVSY
ncbi:hypothetical protein [Serratia sp. BIGb0163]|uniref:hypothetical protein n=1 Tax=Serratia sp. BIGb0163 TaxID=2940613 RepID=UPI0021675413|nr:hypothetical protein [Serratia sp. BIGb0163]MCS4266583.1 hypothetical protein [Serratia sp. BIGb0163]